MHPLRSEDVQSDPSSIFFDTLLSYSNRWRRFQFRSMRRDVPSAPIIRIAALTAVDVPLLESISLDLHSGAYTFCNGTLLTAPTLKHLTLDIYWDDFPNPTVVTDFTVNWATLTSVTLGGAMFGQYGHLCSIDEVAQVLQRTRCLVFCDISVCPGSERTLAEINLPFLEILRVDEEFGPPSSRAPSILDSINAPILSILKIRMTYLDTSLADFFKRSPDIQELTLFHLSSEESLAVVAELLHHCPSLSILSLQPWDSEWTVKKLPDANSFLRAFVHDDGVGIACPRLQKFSFEGAIKFSLQTLHQFLDTKQHGVAPLAALLPWKSVEIDMRWVDDSEIHQMLDLVSQKQAAGLDIHVHVKDDLPLR